jgi:Sulfotransferase domain
MSKRCGCWTAEIMTVQAALVFLKKKTHSANIEHDSDSQNGSARQGLRVRDATPGGRKAGSMKLQFVPSDKSWPEIVEALRVRSMLRIKSLRNGSAASKGRERLTVFVAGVHRWGTNMMMNIVERSWESDIYHESDPRAFDRYLLRDRAVIHELVLKSLAPVVVIKSLHEGHDLRGLLDVFAPARAIWMYRSYEDVINSSLHHWPGLRNMIEQVVEDRYAAEWRGQGMTDETHCMLRRYYRPGINDTSAVGLFWFYRNQILFDQNFDSDDRVRLVRYESLVSDTDNYAKGLTDFIGIDFTPAMKRLAHSKSVRKHAAPQLDAGVRELCEHMWGALEGAHAGRLARQEGRAPRPCSRRGARVSCGAILRR